MIMNILIDIIIYHRQQLCQLKVTLKKCVSTISYEHNTYTDAHG